VVPSFSLRALRLCVRKFHAKTQGVQRKSSSFSTSTTGLGHYLKTKTTKLHQITRKTLKLFPILCRKVFPLADLFDFIDNPAKAIRVRGENNGVRCDRTFRRLTKILPETSLKNLEIAPFSSFIKSGREARAASHVKLTI
jgi:hypothetical protein